MWRLTKELNDEGNGRATTTLEADGQLISGKQAANKLADNYEEVSNIPVTKQHQREARREQRKRKTQQTTNECMDKKLTLNELQAVLRQLKAMKSPGPDAMTNEMLNHLGNKATCKLLEIFNHSWATGTLPQTWREATMILILKKGKDPKQAASYRPISLTSCAVKTMERIVNQTLKWYLETNDLFAPEQAGSSVRLKIRPHTWHRK